MTDETLKIENPTLADVMKELSKRLDAQDLQLEAIRAGLVANSAEFDRLTGKVLFLSADVKELTEAVHKLAVKETLVLEK